MAKKPTITKARSKAWDAMSQYIRQKDAVDGYSKCVTCGNVNHYKKHHAGHFIPQSQGNAVRFEENNVHVQCLRCNVHLGSNGPEYYTFMLDTYGQEEIDRLRALSNTTVKYTIADLQELEQKFKQKLEDLNNG